MKPIRPSCPRRCRRQPNRDRSKQWGQRNGSDLDPLNVAGTTQNDQRAAAAPDAAATNPATQAPPLFRCEQPERTALAPREGPARPVRDSPGTPYLTEYPADRFTNAPWEQWFRRRGREPTSCWGAVRWSSPQRAAVPCKRRLSCHRLASRILCKRWH